MAYILPNLSPTLLQSKEKSPAIVFHQQCSSSHLSSPSPVLSSSVNTQTKLEPPPPRGLAQVNRTPGAQDKNQNHSKEPTFYLNNTKSKQSLFYSQTLNNKKKKTMAYILPNLSPTLLQSKEKSPAIVFHQQCSSSHLSSPSPVLNSSVNTQTKLEPPPPRGLAQVNRTPGAQDKNQNQKDEFYVNLGLAVRTLREDLPLIFTKDLNYGIYRDDITFVDPLNTFTGIENYQLIFWALRFHGRILFREISLDVLRIWQPSENMILIRWNLKGVPRVPWEAKGQFQGTSRYKLDRNGKIYEHKVDNLAFNFPQPLKPAASVLDMVSACPASPNPTFLWGPMDVHSSSWVELYRAVKEALDSQGSMIAQDCLATCS